VRQAEIAHQLGVSRPAVNRWHAAWQAGGADALQPGPDRADAQADQVPVTALLLAGRGGKVPAVRRVTWVPVSADG